jgi:hypothetical protein
LRASAYTWVLYISEHVFSIKESIIKDIVGLQITSVREEMRGSGCSGNYLGIPAFVLPGCIWIYYKGFDT